MVSCAKSVATKQSTGGSGTSTAHVFVPVQRGVGRGWADRGPDEASQPPATRQPHHLQYEPSIALPLHLQRGRESPECKRPHLAQHESDISSMLTAGRCKVMLASGTHASLGLGSIWIRRSLARTRNAIAIAIGGQGAESWICEGLIVILSHHGHDYDPFTVSCCNAGMTMT